ARAWIGVGNWRGHAVRLGERQRLLVVSYAAFSIELVGIGCQVTEKMQRMSPKAGLALRGLNRARAQLPRLINPPKQQTSATHCVVAPAAMTDDPHRRLALEELLGLSHPAQRLAGLADLSQRPGGGGDRPGKKDGHIQAPTYTNPLFDQQMRLRPIALEKMEHACG